VLLVDLDLQVGAAAIMLNILPKKGIVDLVQTAGHLDRELLNSFVSTHPSGLEVLAAPLWSQQEEEALTPGDIEQALTLLSAHYDYLVLDMPAQLHGTALRALSFSTYILLMTSLEVASIQACKRVLQTIGTMEFAKDKIKVVVNVPNAANSLSSNDVAEVLGYPVFWSVPHDVKVAASSQMGEPVVQAHPGSKAAQAITQLHYTLVGAEPERPKGLGGLLRGFKN
jgi:pilus assembly protein CpaE